jgi:hypothetical protein
VVVEIEGVVKVVVPVPLAKGEPPVAAAYQSMVVPANAVALRVSVPVPQREAAVAAGAAGAGFTTNVTVKLLVVPQAFVTV